MTSAPGLRGALAGEAGLTRLIDEAGRRQIDLAADSRLRLALLLTRYAEAGLHFADAEEAGVVIAGVLARSTRDEQALLKLVRELWAATPDAPLNPGKAPALPAGEQPRTDPAVVAVRRAAFGRYVALAFALVLALAGAGLLFWGLQLIPPTQGRIGPKPLPGPALVPGEVFRDLPLRVALATPFLLAAWIVWMRRPQETPRKAGPGPGGIARWLPAVGGLPLFGGLGARRSLKRLGRPLRIRSRRIDVRRSIRATARAGGVPCISFEERRNVLDCVVLVERAGRTDHVAALGGRLATVLREGGARVLHYEFSGSPATVVRVADRSGARGAAIAFDRFAADHARARLLLVSSGNAFLDPRTLALPAPWRDALDAFAQVYLLSPAPRRPAGGRMRLGGTGEAAFRAAMAARAFGHAGARVVAADADGLAAVAASALAPPGDDGEPAPEAPDLPDRLLAGLDARLPLYLSEHLVVPAPDNGADLPLVTSEMSGMEVSALVAALRGHMGSRPAFRLLAALLIYPRLHPDLTVAVAEALAVPAAIGGDGAMEPVGPVLTEDIYLRIARLPWGRQTMAPAWLRLALARALTDTERAAVARALDTVTEKLLPDPPQPRDPERVILTPDDSARLGHPAGVPAADPVFAAFRDATVPLHIAVLSPRSGNGARPAPASAGRWAAIGALLAAGVGGYVFAETIVAGLGAVLAGPAAVLLGWAEAFFGALAGMMSGVLNARICLSLAFLLSLSWLLFPFRITLAARTYREPDPQAIDRFLGEQTAAARAQATRWLGDTTRRLRGARQPEDK